MKGSHAAPGPCQGQAAKRRKIVDKSIGDNHGDVGAPYGDAFRTKGADICRVTYLNPNGLGQTRKENQKMDAIIEFLKKYKVDLLGLSETNVDWRGVSTDDTLYGRLRPDFQSLKVSCANNTRAERRHNSFQRGGTAVVALNQMSQVHAELGQDSRQLGRWSWICYTGTNGVRTRVISVYKPCKNKSGKGYSTYQQQQDFFLRNKITTCPVDMFWSDLKVELALWIQKGDQIVIGGDWNEHVAKVNDRLSSFNLVEAITAKHGFDAVPRTQIRGSTPIDGIFLSPLLKGTQCGYLPFHKASIISDHRIIWIDLPICALVGYKVAPIPPSRIRRLKTKDPRIVKRYQNELHQHAMEHHLYDKAAEVLKQVTYPLHPKQQEQFAKIDHQRCLGMRRAKKRCRRLHTGVYAWSPQFTYCRRLIVYWTLMKHRQLGYPIHARRLTRLMKKLNLPIATMDVDLDGCKRHLDDAYRSYKEVKKKSRSLRVTHLEDLARAIADTDDEDKVASKLRALIHEEEQRRMARAIKHTTKKLFGQGTSRVIVIDSDGKTREITTKEELEHVIIEENKRKYHRTEDYCPLLIGQLRNDIGLCGEGRRVKDILDGTYVCPPGTPAGTVAFIEQMRRPNLPSEAMRCAEFTSIEEFRSAWKRAKEASASCGKLHYGHYKAGLRHDHITALHYTMAQISLESGCYLDRHRTGTDVMLLKKEGDYRLHRLRTICLFDAEFNMNNGRIGKAALDATIKADDMADEQYSRPCRSSLDHVVNRILSFNYFLYKRQPFGLCSCDLAGNYDRIVHSAASLALQRVGVPLPRIYGMFDTIQRLVKKVRTAFGDSAITYGGDTVDYPFIAPPQGVYQGNRNGPPIWSVISSSVFAILRKYNFGAKFVEALSTEIYHLCGFAFVDDTDLVQAGGNSFKVAHDLQEALDLWEGVMNATGQAMAPEKSWWYLVDFVWDKGAWKFTNGQVRSDLVAHDSDGNEVSLKRLMFDQATKMLGVFLAPNGDMAAEFDYLKDKASTWASYIRSGHLSQVETYIATSACIWKTILYPLAATTFTAEELSSITWPILSAALPRMGVCRNIAAALRYGPTYLGGLGLIDPFLEQGIRKIEYLVEHPWRRTPTGNILSSNVQAVALECGIFGNLFEQDAAALQWTTVERSWIRSVWEFMWSKTITISDLKIPFLGPRREKDASLMASFAQSGASMSTLRTLNLCRMYLRVVSLSDISTADGKYIDSTFLPGLHVLPPIGDRRNCFDWPRRPQLKAGDWKTWKTCILSTFCRNTQWELRDPLGPWMDNTFKTATATWKWFGVRSNDGSVTSLLRKEHNTWREFSLLRGSRRTSLRFKTVGGTVPLDDCTADSLVRVSVTRVNNAYILTSVGACTLTSPIDATANTAGGSFSAEQHFINSILALKESGWLFDEFKISGDFNLLLDSFLRGDLLTVSDGSFFPDCHVGSASWILETPDHRASVRASCRVPGPAHLQGSYRSELVGILGITATLYGLSQIPTARQVPPEDWSIVVACDGKSALFASLVSSIERISTRHKHFDVISGIMGLWKQMTCSSFPVHVHGHQDDIFRLNDLSRLERMNVLVDERAKSFLTCAVARGWTFDHVSPTTFGLPVVSIRGNPVRSMLYKTLMDECTKYDLLDFWKRKWSLTQTQFDTFAWESFQRAFKGVRRADRNFVVNWLTNQTAMDIKKRAHKVSSRCPRCRYLVDDDAHCLRCPSARPKFTLLFDSFCDQLREGFTNPDLIVGIQLCTKLWMNPRRRQDPQHLLAHLPPEVGTCLAKHFHFGWLSFLKGLHFDDLLLLQQQHFDNINRPRSVEKWHSNMIRELWSLALVLYRDRATYVAQDKERFNTEHAAIPIALRAAKAELNRGLRRIPVLFQYLFRHTPDSLEGLDPADLQQWLRLVRLNREATKDTDSSDEFSPGGQHRSWLLQTVHC